MRLVWTGSMSLSSDWLVVLSPHLKFSHCCWHRPTGLNYSITARATANKSNPTEVWRPNIVTWNESSSSKLILWLFFCRAVRLFSQKHHPPPPWWSKHTIDCLYPQVSLQDHFIRLSCGQLMIPANVLIGRGSPLFMYLLSPASFSSPKLNLDLMVFWMQYPGSRHGEISMLWTPLKVLRESLSRITVKDFFSRVRILMLQVRIFDSWDVFLVFVWDSFKVSVKQFRSSVSLEGIALIWAPDVRSESPLSTSRPLNVTFL